MNFSHLDIATLREWLDSGNDLTLVDIRDAMSYSAGHVPQSIRLDNLTLAGFLESADKQRPLVVMCYHGNSSQGAAGWLVSQGFSEVYSVDGGFTAWEASFPERVEQ